MDHRDIAEPRISTTAERVAGLLLDEEAAAEVHTDVDAPRISRLALSSGGGWVAGMTASGRRGRFLQLGFMFAFIVASGWCCRLGSACEG
jgi:hypothetical protein